MEHVSPMRGGDEGDLLKHIILLELLDMLAPGQGEFWCLQSHVGEICRVADMSALDWFARSAEDGEEKWDRFPLWAVQRDLLARGEYLGTAGVLLRYLWHWEMRGISVRWVFGHPHALEATKLQEFCMHGMGDEGPNLGATGQQRRMMQLVGGGLESLQELAYLGGARAPGVAVLEPPALAQYGSALINLVETLLIRRFWVVLALPTSAGSRKGRKVDGAYEALLDGLARLQFPGCRYTIEGRKLSWKPNASFEVCCFSPGHELAPLQERVWSRLLDVFGRSLGRLQQGEQLDGIEQLPFPFECQGLHAYELLFPYALQAHLEIDRAREHDVPEVIQLWEHLMDEHAQFDEHFRRRPLARLYLRHSLNSQQNQPDYLLLVVRWKRKPVGFLSAQVLRAPLFQESRVGQIVDVYILPEWRNRRIGDHLVKLAYKWFEAMNIGQIDLNVAVHNDRGKAFWQRQGFRPYLHVVSKDLTETP